MLRRTLTGVLVLAALSALAIATTVSASSGGTVATKVKVALVLPCPTNDNSWCQNAYVAAKRLEKQGLISLRHTASAPQDTTAASKLIERYAATGSQVIFAHSGYQDAAFAAAKKFPKTPIAFAGGGKTGGMVSTYEEPIYQPAYLAGMLAAGITKTGTIGGLAAFDIPLCHAQMEAFKLGAKAIKKSTKQATTYVGDWNDVAKGKSAALALADQGADVFAVCGGGPASGLISAAKERDLSVFGYVGNQNGQAPANMVGSMIYNLYPIFKKIVQDVRTGKYKGRIYDLGLASFDLKLNPKYRVGTIPPAVLKKMKARQAAILAGKFKVPYIPS